jgi:hypothetical protein
VAASLPPICEHNPSFPRIGPISHTSGPKIGLWSHLLHRQLASQKKSFKLFGGYSPAFL